ncbi:MAG TPA: isocitrate lyase/phosphoenolpyruvate mutase family protein [Ignavibacteria bacterium]|nr:isocitrate lyase/phosphoenolpyruvate mutase family protein [Ignavibacteria bacterium]
MNNIGINQKILTFHELHKSGCFIIPNPWDIGTAKYLERQGFKALATTSAGFAFTKGLPDSVSRDVMLAHIKEICSATSLPVNADFQNGYANEPDKVAENVKLCINTGVSGLSIEDATGDKNNPLYEKELAVERIRAARQAIDSAGIPVVLTARCEAYLVGAEEPFKVSIDRLTAFADAGADCLYAPRITDLNVIEEIVKAVAPKPVNVLVTAPGEGLTLERLSELGVRRISVGATLARVAWKGFMQAVQEISKKGTFNTLSNSASFDELNSIFEEK